MRLLLLLVDDVDAVQFTGGLWPSMKIRPELDRLKELGVAAHDPRGSAGESKHVKAVDARGQCEKRHGEKTTSDDGSQRQRLGNLEEIRFTVLGKDGQAIERVCPEIGIELQASQWGGEPVAVVAVAVGSKLIAEGVDEAGVGTTIDGVVGGPSRGGHQKRQARWRLPPENVPECGERELPLPNAADRR